MNSFRELIPDAEILLGMHPPELAGYILEFLKQIDESNKPLWHRRNFIMGAQEDFKQFDRKLAVGIACSASWSWLETNGIICRHPDQDHDVYVFTHRGEEIPNREALKKIIGSEQLPDSFIHPDFLIDVRPLYFQSRFETAVFEAYKSLEVAIRTTAKLGHDLIGINLASRAFDPDTGELTDLSSEKGERVALRNLMVGALGSYKNPSSHRRVQITADEARDMIVLASHLLRIVHARSQS